MGSDRFGLQWGNYVMHTKGCIEDFTASRKL